MIKGSASKSFLIIGTPHVIPQPYYRPEVTLITEVIIITFTKQTSLPLYSRVEYDKGMCACGEPRGRGAPHNSFPASVVTHTHVRPHFALEGVVYDLVIKP